jgi:hypothetical protein
MPSKLYGVLASGTPLIAIAPEHCELSDLTQTQAIGLVTPPGKPKALAQAIEHLADNREQLEPMGTRARQLAEAHYDRRTVTASFARLLENVLGDRGQETVRRPRRQQTGECSIGETADGLPEGLRRRDGNLPADQRIPT